MAVPEQGSDNLRKSAGKINAGRFIATYLGVMSAFVLLMLGIKSGNQAGVSRAYSDFIVILVSALLKGTGVPTISHGDIITLPSMSLQVSFGCNGLEAVMLYAAAVISFPASLKKKLIGVAAGLFLIQVFNVIRLYGLACSTLFVKEYFEFIHLYVAQSLSIVTSLVTFFIYLKFVVAPGDKLG